MDVSVTTVNHQIHPLVVHIMDGKVIAGITAIVVVVAAIGGVFLI